jgi:hypothetical protein
MDLDFLAREARRVAWNSLDSIKDQLKTGLDTMELIKQKYDTVVEPNLGTDAEAKYLKTWEENWKPIYRESYDRYLIYQHVCVDLYGDAEACSHNMDPWEDKYDGRGPAFKEEWVAEVHKVILEDIPRIKSAREQKNDL